MLLRKDGLISTTIKTFVLTFRYTSLISVRKTCLYLALSWFLVLSLAVPLTLGMPKLVYQPSTGRCVPEPNPLYAILHVLIAYLAPIAIIASLNIKICEIAR